MSVANNPLLRNALYLDSAISIVAGAAMAAGSGPLSSLLGIPSGLLFWVGLALVPFGIFLASVARSDRASRLAVLDILIINTLWVAASFAILATGVIEPTMLGAAFIVVQALAVAGLTVAEFAGFRAVPAHA